jgi:hypothetical protein
MKRTLRPAPRRSRAPSREWPSRRARRTPTFSLRRSKGREYFFRVVEQLRIHLPPSRPVTVLAGRQLSDRDGDCSIVRGEFQIRVCKSLNEAEAIECLLHEWAHALSWRACVGTAAKSRSLAPHEFDRLVHGAPWGLAYSKVYLCFTSEIVLTIQVEDLNAEVARRRRGRR